MLTLTKLRRRKSGLPFFLLLIACIVLLVDTVLRPEDRSAAQQDANRPRILNGGDAWNGNRRTQGASAALPGTRLVGNVTRVIPPFLRGLGRRIYAAIFSFCAGVIPPLPMFGRSWL